MRHLQACSTRRMFVQASTKRDRKTPFASADKATDRGMSTQQLSALLPGRRHSLPQTRRQIGGCPLNNLAHFCQEDAIRFRRQGDRSGDVHSTTLCTFARKTPFASADKATDRGMSTLFRCS
ncbi:uncharacterized protein [Littorina saxatilis]|uniref:uncharacterized protein n=1 Tax=Littorina saxatilis TaxID=31220 RepID=UPI0038B57421